MRHLVGMGMALAVMAASGAVSLKEDSVSVSQDAVTRAVTVAYELEGTDDAVVTFDALTNGVSVGGLNLKSILGDVCRIARVGKRSFVWHPGAGVANCTFSAATVKVEVWPLDNPPEYLVCDLDTGSRRYYRTPDSLPGEGGVTNDMYKTDFFVMRKIPAKGVQWRMGRLETEPSVISKDAATQHYVTFAEDYYIGVYEYTYGQYWRTRDAKPSESAAWLGTYPVTNISWTAIRGSNWNGVTPTATSSIGYLKAKTGGVFAFDLTTDEQWEYACRACCAAPFANGATLDSTYEMGWYKENSGGGTHPVGLKRANAWGLYDMHGNVWEQCLDAWYTPSGDSVTASVHSDGGSNAQKVAHGGCFWHTMKDYARSACRINRNYNGSADQGFRVACPAVAK